jgi:hypothetical protein
MKEKIKEVQEYFKAKLLAGDYVVTEVTSDRVKLLIDGLYKFDYLFFIYSSIPTSMSNMNSIMDIEFTEEEKNYMIGCFKQQLEDAKKSEKLIEFQKLKKELYGTD